MEQHLCLCTFLSSFFCPGNRIFDFGKHAQLLPHPQPVEYIPDLGYFSILDTKDVDACIGYFLVRGRQSGEFPYMDS